MNNSLLEISQFLKKLKTQMTPSHFLTKMAQP